MQLRTVEPQHMVVTQANELATAAYSMTLMEKRLVLLVASMMRKDDEYMKRYRFPAADVMNFLGLSSNKNGYQELRKLTADLLSRVVDMDLEGDGDYIQFQWMASARYISKGKSETGKAEIELQAHSQMRPYLLELKERFSSIPFAEIAQLPSFHSVRVFEILWAESHQLRRETVKISLDELKRMLKLEKSYPNYKDFRVRVLDKAQRDLAEKTPLSFTYDTERQGRKVVGLIFTVRANQKAMQLGLNLPQRLSVSELPPMAETVEVQEDRERVVKRLTGLGVRESQAEQFAASYEPEYIAGNLDVVEKRQGQGVVKNLLGYVYKALAQDFRKQESNDERAARERREAKEQAKREQEALESRYERERAQVIVNIKQDVSVETLLEDFQPHIAELGAKNSLIATAHRQHGGSLDGIEGDALLRSFFHQFILDNYALPQYRTFEAWQSKQV